jgi:DNA polymerase
MDIEMTLEQCEAAVMMYHAAYPEVKRFWYDVEGHAKAAVADRGVFKLRNLTFDGRNRHVLRITLPSGRSLHYLSPRLVQEEGWQQPSLQFLQWIEGGLRWQRTYGSRLVENLCQAVARDVLLHGMFCAHDLGFHIIGTVHDELIAEAPGNTLTEEDLCDCMSRRPGWANDTLTLAATGYAGKFYRKA